MRTTVRLDDQLLRAAKKTAAETGRTLTAIIEDALRQSLAKGNTAKKQPRFTLPVLDLGETMPGVDLDNSAALLDLMEAADGAV
jgi:Ribbon-helix-helix protein, copG family